MYISLVFVLPTDRFLKSYNCKDEIMKLTFAKFFSPFILILLVTSFTYAQVNVLTQHNNLERTGWNNRETILNKNNTVPGKFGKLFTRLIDDQMYAQPLVMQQVSIPFTGKRNVLYAATVNNTVYAFDADSINKNEPYWKVNLTPPGERPIKQIDLPGACPGNFLSNIGIVGTPVIDSVTNTLYLVARSINSSTGKCSQYLHAIDIGSGQERANSPVLIQALVNGKGDGNINGIVHFDPMKNNQRPALLLLNGIVYIGFSSHCDWGPYHGWLLGYNESSLKQEFVYNDTPEGYNGGIWMSGTGPAADSAGNIYLATGNGSVGKNNNPSDLINRSESVIRLKPDNTLPLVKDFFTPNNFPDLEASDLDLGTSGVMIIPNANRVITGCKDGNIYLLNQANLGGYNASGNLSIQTINLGNYANMHAQFSYYGGSSKEFAYFWPENTALKAIPFDRVTKKFIQQDIITSGIPGPIGQTGSMLSVSSNGNNDSTAILWSSAPVNCDGENYNCPGILRAIDANDVTRELWNSNIVSSDNPGLFAKFSSPTIANGKVYLSTFSNQIIVYGLVGNIADTCTSPNIALHKMAFASSTEGSQFPASYVTDGDLNTRWSSSYSDPQTIYIDLGKRYDLCKVILHWEAAFGKDFKIQVSMDTSGWQTIANYTGNNSTYNILNVKGSGRYIRMYGTARATPYGFSLYEFEVYGKPSVTSCGAPTAIKASNIYENTATLSWEKQGADSFRIYYKPVNSDQWTIITNVSNSIKLTGLTCGSDYFFKVQGICSGTSVSEQSSVFAFSTLRCNNNCGMLPAKWMSQDIGNTSIQGSSCYTTGTFKLNASGNDIWDFTDQFHFAYVVIQGDGSIIIRVSSIDKSNEWNKCGIMIRESLDPGSRHALLAITSSKGLIFQYRKNTDNYSNSIIAQGIIVPYWIKLVKKGSTFSAFKSLDKSTWTQVGNTIDLLFGNSSPFYCGLALTSHNNSILSTSLIDNFTSSGFTESILQSFTGEVTSNQKILLHWITELEVNTNHFILEKSIDNIHFNTIDSVGASNHGRFMTQYESKDNSPSPGINYYRIKVVDIFGNFKYSQLLVLRLSTIRGPLIYPNPALNNINVVQGDDVIKSISIYDFSGRLMIRQNNESNNVLMNIPLYNLAKSVYTIEIRTPNNVYRNKLVKR